ncbi:hypothetical protein [Bacillus sp. FJAT-22090]|uniref:hypothetical protein n=1 Tax=Bacillus sp. FJAT-22090 TaxID=1581038 RepID=UPI0011A68977|nr:hypothetical protein [Bacillus sp. FJAT-22090]
MKELHRKYELILEGVSFSITTNVDNALTFVEINNVETFVDEESNERANVSPDGVGVALDYEDLNEIITLLTHTRDVLIRSETKG